jgi:hypothetical protein
MARAGAPGRFRRAGISGMLEAMPSALAVVVDGTRLGAEEARLWWQRFSAYMDANRGDFEGFAKQEGFASARVAVLAGAPTLTLSRRAEEPEPARPRPRRRRRGRGR